MSTKKETVFSEFEARSLRFIFPAAGKEQADVYVVRCVGKVESEAGVKVITKSCRGKVAKKRTRATGEGTLKMTAHMPNELYTRLHAMQRDDLKDGVCAYGEGSLHPEVCVTADVYDEDDNQKLKAWPRCVVSTGAKDSIENGAEEVAEVELEIGYMPDEYGEGMYESIVSNLTDQDVIDKWLEEFTPGLVRKADVPESEVDESTPSV